MCGKGKELLFVHKVASGVCFAARTSSSDRVLIRKTPSDQSKPILFSLAMQGNFVKRSLGYYRGLEILNVVILSLDWKSSQEVGDKVAKAFGAGLDAHRVYVPFAWTSSFGVACADRHEEGTGD